jgi:hypothetical protein
VSVVPGSVGGTAVAQPEAVCGGTGTTLTVANAAGTVIRWESSIDGGSSWLSLLSSAGAS